MSFSVFLFPFKFSITFKCHWNIFYHNCQNPQSEIENTAHWAQSSYSAMMGGCEMTKRIHVKCLWRSFAETPIKLQECFLFASGHKRPPMAMASAVIRPITASTDMSARGDGGWWVNNQGMGQFCAVVMTLGHLTYISHSFLFCLTPLRKKIAHAVADPKSGAYSLSGLLLLSKE